MYIYVYKKKYIYIYIVRMRELAAGEKHALKFLQNSQKDKQV